MKKKFAKRYKKSVIPDRLYQHINDILLNINKKSYLTNSESEYKSYLKKGDKEYSKTLKDKVGTNVTIRHLERAKNYYASAKRSAHNFEKEQVARRRLGYVRNALSILERRTLRKEKVLELFSSLDDRLGNLIKDIQKSQKTLSLFIFASFILSLFFLSMNFTGAVIESAQQDFSILGILFFISGLIFAFIYARKRR